MNAPLVLDAKLGWDLLNKAGRMGFGPMVSFVHVFQPDSEFRPDDANLLLFGVHAMYDFNVQQVIGDRDHDGIFSVYDETAFEQNFVPAHSAEVFKLHAA